MHDLNALEELKNLSPETTVSTISYPVNADFFAHQKGKKNVRGFTSGLIVTPENKVILAKRGAWFMPGGGVEIGESFSNAMKREIIEEVGVDVHDLSLVAIDKEEFISPAGEKVFSILGVFAMKTVSVDIPPLTHDAKEEGIEEVALFEPDNLPADMALTDRDKILAFFDIKR